MPRTMIFKSPWGWVGIAESERGIVSIILPQSSKAGASFALRARAGEPVTKASSARLRAARRQLLEYLAGTRRSFALPLDVSGGTSFQRRVWKELQSVPYGKLQSYQGLASAVGGKRYARAVGGAVGANPLPVVIPCHRIVTQDASLGGFSCGLPMKRRLLALEGSLARLRRSGRDI